METSKRKLISIITRNRPGILSRITGAISGKWLDIHSLSTCICNKNKDIHQIIISTGVSDSKKQETQLLSKLERIVPVLKARVLEEKKVIERELVLAKIIADVDVRSEALALARDYRAFAIDLQEDSLIFEMVGSLDKVTEFLEKLRPLGLQEYSRSGSIVLNKGSTTIFNDIEDYQI